MKLSGGLGKFLQCCACAEHPWHRGADPGCWQDQAAEARQGEHPLPFPVPCRTARRRKAMAAKRFGARVQPIPPTQQSTSEDLCGSPKLSNYPNRHSLTLNLEIIPRSIDEQKTVHNGKQRVIATCTKRPSNLNYHARLCKFYQLSEQTCIVINY